MYRHRQLHLWITDHDYVVLRSLANEQNESLSAVIRKLIKLQRPGTSAHDSEADGAGGASLPPV
jgi:hypothetical protein